MSPADMLTLLSHHLSTSTPAFAGGEGMRINAIKEIATGGSSNNYWISLPCHLGTHIDAPRHFSEAGRPIASYSPEDLVFDSPLLVDVPKAEGELVLPGDLERFEEEIGKSDMLLVRTGFERYRSSDPKKFSTQNPGFSVDAASYLTRFRGLKALGLDAISLSSVVHREEGRGSHRKLLTGRDFFIVEDMHLARYPHDVRRVIVAPMFVDGVDSVPCTVIAET